VVDTSILTRGYRGVLTLMINARQLLGGEVGV
jgi:hypothetical protein